jgi:hypothetical protein
MSLLHSVDTGSDAHSASYLMGTRVTYTGAVKLTTRLHLVPSSGVVELYLHFTIHKGN